jgi:GMP synthase-like glutamine amidotransferase
VLKLPAAAVGLGGNPDCAYGSFALGDHVLTTQYHPEMTPDFIAALIEELAGKLPTPVIAQARASVRAPADTARIAARIVDFFERSAA